jgi:hypothetical protein
MHCIVGLSLAVRTVSYRTVRSLPYVLHCIALGPYRVVLYRTVLYSPRKYSTNRGSFMLCGLCCIVSSAVRIVSYRFVSYCASGRTVQGLPYVCIVLYRSQFVSCRIVSYRTVLPDEIRRSYMSVHDCMYTLRNKGSLGFFHQHIYQGFFTL